MAPFDFRGGGFVSAAELERWFELTVSRVAAVRPFILALADLLVADLLRFPPGTR
jgi:hypothetical protein